MERGNSTYFISYHNFFAGVSLSRANCLLLETPVPTMYHSVPLFSQNHHIHFSQHLPMKYAPFGKTKTKHHPDNISMKRRQISHKKHFHVFLNMKLMIFFFHHINDGTHQVHDGK